MDVRKLDPVEALTKKLDECLTGNDLDVVISALINTSSRALLLSADDKQQLAEAQSMFLQACVALCEKNWDRSRLTQAEVDFEEMPPAGGMQ